MSHEVRLKIRLEDRKSQSIPKRCSSCFGKPAPNRRVLTAQYQARRLQRVQWNIQLPLCDRCQAMAEVLADYRPSKHGPTARARDNKRVAAVLAILSIAAIIALFVPATTYTTTIGFGKGIVFGVLALAFVGLYYWNYRANENGREAAYQAMAEQVGHKFGDVTIEKGVYGPILTFDNEEFGRAFAEANPDFILDADIPQAEIDQFMVERETKLERVVRYLRMAFRIK